MGARWNRPRLGLLLLLWLATLGTLVYAAWIAGFLSEGLGPFLDLWVYNGVLVVCGLVCLVRAWSSPPGQRAPWVAFGLGLGAWAAADTYWVVAFQFTAAKEIPYPSLADAGYLAAIPCFFAGIALLVRQRSGHFPLAGWLDGAIGALGSAALGTAILAPALVGLTKGNAAAVLTNLAYPILDLLLIAFIVAVLVVHGSRNATVFFLLGAGLLVWAISDSIYLHQEATSSYVGGWLDEGWLVGALLIAYAASAPELTRARRRQTYHSSVLLPSLFAAVASGILAWDHFERVPELALWLCIATLAAVVIRLAISLRENSSLLAALHDDSVTDSLTGLGNRRRLLGDLEAWLDRSGGGASRRLFALFDLDGFKAYNDGFGHPAGDALLRRLGANLDRALRPVGAAYRLGGDEFCILANLDGEGPDRLMDDARAALTGSGEGFSISASGGAVLLGVDAQSAEEALRLADTRMYAEKRERAVRADRQTGNLLVQVARDREPELGNHQEGVARLARQVGRTLQLSGEDLDVLVRAAELHDIGKIAIPAEILNKPGQLDDHERALMEKHTLVGERLIRVSPAMAPVARAVRSSHERWDGQGYPDGLSGEEIPLAARIILVCDAYHAMVEDRPYRTTIPPSEALAELRKHAGTQFEPRLVEAICQVVDADRSFRTKDAATSGAKGAPAGAAAADSAEPSVDAGLTADRAAGRRPGRAAS